MVKYIQKRDGRVMDFDASRITDAIMKSVRYVGGSDLSEAERMTGLIVSALNGLGEETVSFATIQDTVEHVLIAEGHSTTAKNYILYRGNKESIKQMSKKLMDTLEELTMGSSSDVEIKRENANIDGDTAMGTMLRYGSEAAKLFNLGFFIPQDIRDAHLNGDIHIHDLDFYSLTETCCQIDLEKLFEGGFSTGHGTLREPSNIRSYASLACIAIQANQNDQHGGQSVPAFDYYMAPGVAKTFVKQLKTVLDIRHPECTLSDAETDSSGKLTNLGVYRKLKAYRNKHRLIMDSSGRRYIESTLQDYYCGALDTKEIAIILGQVESLVKDETYQAMEALVHNLNSMHSRAGAQVPFSSLNFGTDTSEEGRLASYYLLKATEDGLGEGETPIFPISIMKLKHGINFDKGDKNYDLFRYAMKVSAKRLFPNFSFIDAPFNLQYYKEGRPETEVATMGCVEGEEVIRYSVDGQVYIETFRDAFARVSQLGDIKTQGCTEYIDIPSTGADVRIYDTASGGFVFVKKFIRNHNVTNWRRVRFSGGYELSLTGDHPLPVVCKGRVLVDSLIPSDQVCRANTALPRSGSSPSFQGDALSIEQAIPTDILCACLETRQRYAALLLSLNANIYNIDNSGFIWTLSTNSKGFINTLRLLLNSLQVNHRVHTLPNASKKYTVNVEIDNAISRFYTGVVLPDPTECYHFHHQSGLLTVTAIKDGLYSWEDASYSYDVETESDTFDVSGVCSHNCRTRVIGNFYDPTREIVAGRGNLSFTSINLPRLAIKANNGVLGAGNIDKFYELLDSMLDLVHRQLLERYKVQCRKTIRNYPFLMGQGIWLESDTLDIDDDISEILRHGTLSVGFIGLAETLKMLIGKHHGESDEAQELGLAIVQHMRDITDSWSKAERINYGIIGTPAEGLSGRFIRIDKRLFGEIQGVTDREYYTNSSHVPVYFDIDVFSKIHIEAPYHALENAGHICYIELDGDVTQNIDAFEAVIRCMGDEHVGYGAINHPVDRDPVCGYVGVIGDTCPRCGRHEFEPMTEDMWHKIKHKASPYNAETVGYYGDRHEESDRRPLHIHTQYNPD